MAAPAFQSSQTTTWATTTTRVVTKPTGLAVGDLMIAQYVLDGTVSSAPSGFTLKDSQLNVLTSAIYYKIADSGDVAASDFTFTSTASVLQFASITRITGASTIGVAYMYGEGTANDTSTPSIAAGVTPKSYGDSVLLLQFWFGTPAITSISTYAIATSNPSWTEAYDVTNGANYTASMAYGTRPELTATGNISCAGGDASTDWIGQLLAIPVPSTFTFSETATLTESFPNTVLVNIAETASLTETISNPAKKWTNQNKSSQGNITNQEKHG